MQQVSQIAEIIEETLNDEGLCDFHDTAAMATTIAHRLVGESLQVLATILGTDLETNEDGETILNLGTPF
jgi:hypothetical protein